MDVENVLLYQMLVSIKTYSFVVTCKYGPLLFNRFLFSVLHNWMSTMRHLNTICFKNMLLAVSLQRDNSNMSGEEFCYVDLYKTNTFNCNIPPLFASTIILPDISGLTYVQKGR